MNRLNDICLLAADTGRARAYLAQMKHAGLLPGCAVVIGNGAAPTAPGRAVSTPLFDNITPLPQALTRAGIPFAKLKTGDVNAPEVCAAVADCPGTLVIFAGPAGAIVREQLFATGKDFLHVHPGRVPDFRGSTPMYYSLLAEGRMAATAILLSPEIDEGPVVGTMEFDPPQDRSQIDLVYDPWMRSVLLVDVLRQYSATGLLALRPQNGVGGPAFFIIHPVLKHLVILAGSESSD